MPVENADDGGVKVRGDSIEMSSLTPDELRARRNSGGSGGGGVIILPNMCMLVSFANVESPRTSETLLWDTLKVPLTPNASKSFTLATPSVSRELE